MERYEKEFARIKKLLKDNPHGMTITQISNKLNMNRNTCAKYLDLLQVLGYTIMQVFGTAKVYFPSDRMPISTLINIAIDGLLIMNAQYKIIKTNDRFLDFFSFKWEDIVGKKFNTIDHEFFKDEDLFNRIVNSFGGKENSIEKKYVIEGKEKYFVINILPVIFDDNEPGVSLVLKDITDRKIAELELKESEEKFRRIFETIPDHFFLISKDMKVIEYKGDPAELGLTEEDLIGKDVLQHLPEKFREKARKNALEVLKTKKPKIVEYYQIINGTKKYFEARMLYYSENQVAGFIRDITDRKLSEEKIRESEEKFRMISDQNMMGIAIIQDGYVKYVNKAIIKMIGYTIDEIYNWEYDEFLKIVHPDDRKQTIKKGMKIRDSKESDLEETINFRIITKTGEVRWWETYVKRIKFQGKIADLLTIIDITDKKEAELRLKESEEKFRSITEQNLIGILIFQGGKIKYANKATQDILEFTEEELLNLSEEEIFNILHPDSVEIAREGYKKALKSEKDYSSVNQFKIITKNGNVRWLKIFNKKFRFDKEDAFLVVLIDVSSEEEFRRKKEESELKFKSITEQSLFGICIVQNNIIKYVNDACARNFGTSPDSLIDTNINKILDKIHPEDRNLVKNTILNKASFQDNEVRNFQIRVKNGTNEIIWLNIYVRKIIFEEIPTLLLMTIDITENKNLLEELEYTNEIYKAFFNSSFYCVYIHD
ncbi:MAG: PAS domain-containing protein, partial [Candidatus Helarchaeota archaeon]